MNQIPGSPQSPNNTNEAKPEQVLQVMQILSGAIGFSVIMLGLVLYITKKPILSTQLFTENMRNPTYLILFLVGFATLLVRVPLANSILAQALAKSKPETMKDILPLYFVPLILRLALAEAGAILGFISTQLSGEATPYAILAASAFISIVREVPTFDKIKERVSAINPQIRL